MKTFFEGEQYEIYGEPTPQMVEEFVEQGLAIIEAWPGEVALSFHSNKRQLSETVMAAIVTLSQQA